MSDSPGNPRGSNPISSDSREPVNTEGAALHDAIRTLSSNLSLDMVLQLVADLSRELVSANYSALGIKGRDGSLAQFITSGISRPDRDKIGDPPEGKGVLGVVLREGQSLRMADLGQHPESTGQPEQDCEEEHWQPGFDHAC